MGKVVAFTSLTLDGVMQAPGRPDEDRRGGRGGWAQPYNDPVMGRVAAKGMAQEGALLLGRRTYEDFFSSWPKRPDNPFTEYLLLIHPLVLGTGRKLFPTTARRPSSGRSTP
jgi:dihydrofolate reductase